MEFDFTKIYSNRLINIMYDLEAKYLSTFGVKPYNISLWDPSSEFHNDIRNIINIPLDDNFINYNISSYLPFHNDILVKLGYDPKISGCLITPTGSTSILCAINWLQFRQIKKIEILCPCYYTIIAHCKKIGIKTKKIYFKRLDQELIITKTDKLYLEKSKTIWATNPIYSTGQCISNELIEFLEKKLSQGCFVVLDECLAQKGYEIGPLLGKWPNFIGFHCPHKAISINGIKFSVLVFNKKFQYFYEEWADVLYGCLLSSNIVAIKHFLSNNYDVLNDVILERNKNTLKFVNKVFSESNNCFLYKNPMGNFITGYASLISYRLGNKKKFQWDLIANSGTSFISGNKYYFDPNGNFCFRINLARDSAHFRNSLNRLILALSRFTF